MLEEKHVAKKSSKFNHSAAPEHAPNAWQNSHKQKGRQKLF